MAVLYPTGLTPPLTDVSVTTSRDLVSTDNGKNLVCSVGVALTVPTGLPSGFFCRVSVDDVVVTGEVYEADVYETGVYE